MDPTAVPHVSRRWWVLVVAIVAAGLATWLIVTEASTATSAAGHETPAMMQVAPGGEVALASLPGAHQVVYEAAAADEEAMTQVRCYCGCESFLDHRHLLDCFVRPDGGWERHATGCAVCIAEAEDVLEMRANGDDLDVIIERIDRRYGGITSPAV